MFLNITPPSGNSIGINLKNLNGTVVSKRGKVLTVSMNNQDDILIGGEEDELFSIEKELIEAKNAFEKEEREVKALNDSISEAMAATAAKMFQESFKREFESLKKEIQEMKNSLNDVNQTIVKNKSDLKTTTEVVENLAKKTTELNKILYGE